MTSGDAAIDGVIAQYGYCRSYGHTWEFRSRNWSRKKKVGGKYKVTEINIDQICSGCKCVRTRVYRVGNLTMILVDSKMTYPDGYVLKGRRLRQAEAMYRHLLYEDDTITF